MKQIFSLLLCLALFLTLLAGCGTAPVPGPENAGTAAADTRTSDGTAAPTAGTVPLTEPAASETPAPETTAAPPLPEITWAKAFRTKAVPEGSVDAEHIAFLHKDEDGNMTVVNVPIAEVRANQPERLPRTRYFEQFIQDALVEELMPAVDYAMANSFSRLCIPTTGFNYGDINGAARYLLQTYSVNDSNIGSLDIASFPRADGETLTFVLITIGGMEKGSLIGQYREGVAAARAIVDAMPEGLDERGKMLYLYKYLTDNVRYDYNDYYIETNWCLLYDALVRHSTVCAGYTEALYVLANLAGIDCFMIEGFINDAYQPGAHVWNVARIDGTYYQFDSTWDEGLSPAEYDYFGVSTDYMMEYHTKHIVAFAEEYCPPCPDNLMPEAYFPESNEDPTYPIYWYYRLCNARDYSPAQLFRYFRYEEDEVKAGEPEDGWVTTAVSLTDFCQKLTYVMTTKQMALFIVGSFQNDADGNLMYRVPEEDPTLVRLCGCEEAEDGTWIAHLMVIGADGGMTPRDDRITVEQYGDYWFVSDVTQE